LHQTLSFEYRAAAVDSARYALRVFHEDKLALTFSLPLNPSWKLNFGHLYVPNTLNSAEIRGISAAFQRFSVSACQRVTRLC
jgi:hypothetical protein